MVQLDASSTPATPSWSRNTKCGARRATGSSTWAGRRRPGVGWLPGTPAELQRRGRKNRAVFAAILQELVPRVTLSGLGVTGRALLSSSADGPPEASYWRQIDEYSSNSTSPPSAVVTSMMDGAWRDDAWSHEGWRIVAAPTCRKPAQTQVYPRAALFRHSRSRARSA